MLNVSAIKQTNEQKEAVILDWNKKYKNLTYFYNNPKCYTFIAVLTP